MSEFSARILIHEKTFRDLGSGIVEE